MGIVSRRIHGWHMLLGLSEVLAAGIFFGLMILLWQSFFALVEDAYSTYLGLVLVALLVDNFYHLRRSVLIDPSINGGDKVLVLRRSSVVAFVWFAYLAARQDHAVSRLFLFAYLFLLPAVLFLARRLTLRSLAPVIFGAEHRFGVVLIGNPGGSEDLVDWLSSKHGIGVHVEGYLSTEPSTDSAHSNVKWLGNVDALTSVVQDRRVRLVVSLDLPENDHHARKLRQTCDRLGTRLAFQCKLGGDSSSRLSICQDEGVCLLSVRNEPLQSPFNRLMKRAFDLAVAIPVIALALPPIALLVWVMHKIYSPGPLLFKQQRGGLAGRKFTMLKFRTMHTQEHDESVQTSKGDKRIFRGGAWLRKYSLDEFPQFLNVLMGSMSVVGPRPHLEAHDAAFSMISPEYRVRALIKPGITGLAQVQGHRGPTPEEHHVNARVKADLRYLENWSLGSDLVLVLRTAANFLRPMNAV
jgi:exopolysaccharide biosynthesis polyprenyl glycosylphosphotransferase